MPNSGLTDVCKCVYFPISQMPKVFSSFNRIIQLEHLMSKNFNNVMILAEWSQRKKEGCPLAQSFLTQGSDTLVHFNY